MAAPEYENRLLLSDPWNRPSSLMCTVCGCWVANEEVHTNYHASPNVELSPAMMHVVAGNLRAQYPAAASYQPVPEYYRNQAIHALADAIDAAGELAPTPHE